MIKIPVDDIIQKISEQASLSKDEIDKKVEKKMEQLSGLISREGAAHIIANELGVKLVDLPQSGAIQIKNILPGMRSIETAGKVQQIYEVRNFNVNGREGKVGSFLMGDETGAIRVVLWNDQVNNMESLKEGHIVKLTSAYAKDNQGRKELHVNDKSKFVINPLGISIEAKAKGETHRKSIGDLGANDQNVEIVGTVVQVFNIRFFETCPQCGKRARERADDGFYCEQHSKIDPTYSYVLNMVIDDGTGTIRTVLFRNQVERLLKMDEAMLGQYRNSPQDFEAVKNELIGNMVKFVGRVNKNDMFDRLEFVSNAVFPDIDPEVEIRRLENEIAQRKKDIPKVDQL